MIKSNERRKEIDRFEEKNRVRGMYTSVMEVISSEKKSKNLYYKQIEHIWI